MRDILGYDCDGRALRAGDRVEIACDGRRVDNDIKQHAFTLSGETLTDEYGDLLIFIERACDGSEIGGYSFALRLINSGRELFDKYASEASKIKPEQPA